MPQYTLGLTQLIGHGRAFTQLERPTVPAAGAGFTITQNGRYWALVDSLAFQLVTSATVADRLVTLTVKDGGGIAVATVPAAATQAASTTAQYTFLPGVSTPVGLVGGAQLNIFPSVFLQGDFSIVVAVANIDTTDAITNIRLYKQQFETGNDGYLLGPVATETNPLAELGELATYRS